MGEGNGWEGGEEETEREESEVVGMAWNLAGTVYVNKYTYMFIPPHCLRGQYVIALVKHYWVLMDPLYS